MGVVGFIPDGYMWQLVIYKMAITSLSKNRATGVVVSNPLPPGTVLIALFATQGTITSSPPVGSTGTVIFNVGSLGNGATATITISVRVTAQLGGTLIDTATVTSTTQDLNGSNNSATRRTTVTQ